MTGIDMDAIRQRWAWVQDNADQCQRDPGQVSLSGYMAASIDSSRDVPTLIAEVERLRALESRVRELTVSTDGDPINNDAEIPVGEIVRVLAESAERCPTCESPAPHLHPAVQSEGEVQPCRDPWHAPSGGA